MHTGTVVRGGLAIAIVIAFGACSAPRSRHLAATGALGPYSAAVMSGELCFVSGKIGTKRDDFAGEVESAVDALEAELARAQLSLADVVLVNVYLTDMSLYAELNTIYARRFPEPYPARACVAVSALPGGARVELQAIAHCAD
jgi:2-iminobutanoate/2-iminopropanoate deaminase